LISTMYTDPSNPMARPQPLKDYVKQKISTDKQKKLVDDLVAKNNVSVPDDYTVPQVTDEQIQQMMKNQGGHIMGGPQGGPPPPVVKDPAATDKKPSAKKTK